MSKVYDIELNNKLFGLDYCSDYSEEEQDSRIDLAEATIKDCGEEVVFEAWFKYLKESVNTNEEARSFMLWFYNYNGAEFTLKDPYSFLGLLFVKLGYSLDDNDLEKDEFFGTFDSIYVSLLIKAGFVKEVDYFVVNLFNDPKFKAVIERYEQQ